jgi:hypothetical protein
METLGKTDQDEGAHSSRRKGTLDLVQLLVAVAVNNHVHLVAFMVQRYVELEILLIRLSGQRQFLARGVRKPHGCG